jgi:hypothetical protein
MPGIRDFGSIGIKDANGRHKACARAGHWPDPSAGHDEII